MGKQKVGRPNIATEKILARTANAGAGIEKKTMLTHFHFDATGVAAISHMFRR
jgi:hypothetical protein